MDLHGQMMNIQTPFLLSFSEADSHMLCYKRGHRDARHAAAELALKADACIEALRDIMDTGFAGGPQAKRAREALSSLDGQVLVSG